MKFLGFEIRKASKQEISNLTSWNSNAVPLLQSRSKPMLLSTVYRCVDLISDSVAVLPLKTYKLDSEGFKSEYKDHPAYYMLDMEPNEHMTRFVFFKTLMSSVLLTGNGYAYIERDSLLRPLQLVYIPSSQVSIEWVIDKNGIQRKRYRVNGFKELVDPRDMIHVLNFSYDGIIGVSTLTHARQSLNIATASEEHAAGFFKGGASMSGIIKQVAGPRMDEKQKDQMYSVWEKRMNPITGTPNGVMIIDANYDYHTISVSPKDSQLLESRQFNVVDICRFFSVSPVKAFDLSKSSYSTVEATQLQYLTDTVLAVITKIEQEVNRKVFLLSERGKVISEFDTSAILRTDKSAQAAYWKDMANVGAATPNEIRRENNLPRIDNGDKAFVQANVQTIDNAVKEKLEESKNNPDLYDNNLVSK